MRVRRMGGALFGAALVLASCASNPVQMRRIDLASLVRAHEISAYDSDRVSDRTRALIDRLGLAIEDIDAAIERLAQPIESESNLARLLARSELLYRRASGAPPAARPRDFLDSALDAMGGFCCRGDQLWAAGAVDPRRNDAILAHGYALTRFLIACQNLEKGLPALVRRLRDDFGIVVDWRYGGKWKLEDFDRILCADTLSFTGLRHRYRRPGFGVPLVLVRDAKRGIPAYLTPEAICRAATVVLRPPTESGGAARLEVLDPRTTRSVEVAKDLQVSLAADFTAPFGVLLAEADLHAIEDRSFFDADAAGHDGLFLLEDYDPKRRPVVMVHGLWSSPLTWRDVTNDIFGDETLHRRYQVWHYMYATGTPLLENGRQLREALRKARRDLDPELDDYATQEIVLVGHSMGGLLSRMALSDSGNAIWDTLFEGDFDDVELHLEDKERELARGLYFWKSLPFVKKAVFIAVPHRGSEVSDSWIGRLGSSLMYVPRRLRRLVNKIRGRVGVRVEVPTSVDELSGSHPVLQTLSRLQMAQDLEYHSIMGDVSESEDPNEWTDGVVRYVSSKLDGAASELVIRGGDHGVHFDPRASAEVRRILREHDAPEVRR